jgi:hypothetical protein
MSERCDSCKFWAAGTDEEIAHVTFRQCRRNPPMTTATYKDGVDHGIFPYTPSGAWCGEFRYPDNHHG